MHQEHKNTITQNKMKQLKSSGFGRLFFWPGKTAGLFSKGKVSKEVSEEKRK